MQSIKRVRIRTFPPHPRLSYIPRRQPHPILRIPEELRQERLVHAGGGVLHVVRRVVVREGGVVLDEPVPREVLQGDLAPLLEEDEAAPGEEGGEGVGEVVACLEGFDESVWPDVAA